MRHSAGPNATTAADATATFLVSLYLVLLAFFILLAVISTFDTAKSERVLQSVTARLGPGPGWLADARDDDAGTGSALQAAAALRRDLQQAFEAEIPSVRFGVSQSGRTLEASMPLALVFEDGRTTAKPAIGVLAGRVSRGLTAALPTVRARVEVIVRGAAAGPAPSLDIRRADALARGLRAAGLADSAIAAGVEAGVEAAAEPEVRFVFRLTADGATGIGG